MSMLLGIIICGDYALVLKDGEHRYLPKFNIGTDEPLDAFCKGIRKTAGFKRDHLMFVKELAKTTFKEREAKCLIFKSFLYEYPTSYKGQEMEWVDIRNLRRILTDGDEQIFCKGRSSEIYNAKYEMQYSPAKYPSWGIR